ncbi:hypothetical protein SAMN05421780_108192 [Flexibacter flexilis DSM 6793]|uniref:Uncharacterized protein n=1 Tax=Flexibacter flexilis DSM 6793 TaxID=927664 RepID=A0A1I1LE88_9BACT|nr:hypothetical protein [Flexibacter flexilis]SFC71321.1 hypothetical protein SAMN05421780_108192 [Flexibacter flexilis DSM 6793]
MNELNLNQEQLSALEDMAALFFSLEELAVIMQVERERFVSSYQMRTGVIYETVQRGRLRQEALVRKKNFELAQQGSSPAITAALKLIDSIKLGEEIR